MNNVRDAIGPASYPYPTDQPDFSRDMSNFLKDIFEQTFQVFLI